MPHRARGIICIIVVVFVLSTAPPLARGEVNAPATQPSPRMAALAAEIAASRTDAASERFWQEMRQRSPIIEPFADDPSCSWVTFVWRGDAETRRVGLIGGPVGHSYSKWLDRLGDSDVWYRTERISNTARFLYSYQVDRKSVV